MSKQPKRSVFARYLTSNKISASDAAKALNITRAYVHMLRTLAATPSLHTAAAIKKWTKGAVTFESWL